MAVLETMSDHDRQWFESHPGCRCFLRPYVPGEYGPAQAPDANHVLVIEMMRGARMRHPLKIYRDDDGPVKELTCVPTGERWVVAHSGAVLPTRFTSREIWQALLSDDMRRLIEALRRAERQEARR